jgi:hypothetical protein
LAIFVAAQTVHDPLGKWPRNSANSPAETPEHRKKCRRSHRDPGSPISARRWQTSQEIKKEADTVVDSITASDIGAFPDKSVAEALQRMTGVAVTRFAASGDTTTSPPSPPAW